MLQYAQHLHAKVLLCLLRDTEMSRRLDGSHEELSPAKGKEESEPPKRRLCKHSEGIIGLFDLAVKACHGKAVSNAAIALGVKLQAIVKPSFVGQHVRGSNDGESAKPEDHAHQQERSGVFHS